MTKIARCFAVGLATVSMTTADVQSQSPDNLVVEGIPAFSDELRGDAARYLEFRSAGLNGWHPRERQMLITTRFADSAQLHLVKTPGAARKQLTFLPEPVRGGGFQPGSGDYIVFAQDQGGSEFFQLYRYDLASGKITLLTDGKSRHTSPRFSYNGRSLAFCSTKRTGRDTDVYVANPLEPKSERLVLEVTGGGWQVADWAHDDSKLLIQEYVSINESYLHVLDLSSKEKTLLTPKENATKIAYSNPRFSADGKSIYYLTDKNSEFKRLAKLDLGSRKETILTSDINWDVDELTLSKDGSLLAFVTNEDGVGVLHLMDAKSGKQRKTPKLPVGTIGNLDFHDNHRDLAFNLSSAKSPNDVYSVDVKTGKVERWTESETGGLNPESFVEPEMLSFTSFDGTRISGFIYRPDAKKFPGKRPVLINIHGGPEGQSQPGFQARNNYYINELGAAMVYPNVRGSSGYGKTFLTLDNGFKREDSVKDIGAVIDWIKRDDRLDSGRIAVMGGSYGGYMVLASMIHFSDDLKCGVDVVGISNFLTFLKNTQDYRRDLRRVEYGDERDEKMRVHLEKISPMTNAEKIKKPLFVVQGKNDPRVPLSESEQMVKKIRDHGGTVWYLMAKDEGHGFAKKRNADYQFLAMIQFYKEHLLK